MSTDKTAVQVEIRGWRDGEDATYDAWVTIYHDGERVRAMYLPEGWRAMCRQVGLDDELLATEGYLETLARIEFMRRDRSRG